MAMDDIGLQPVARHPRSSLVVVFPTDGDDRQLSAPMPLGIHPQKYTDFLLLLYSTQRFQKQNEEQQQQHQHDGIHRTSTRRTIPGGERPASRRPELADGKRR